MMSTKRPWLTGYGMDEGRDEFDAYETWLEERSAGLLATLLDEGIQVRVDLFAIMCDLCDAHQDAERRGLEQLDAAQLKILSLESHIIGVYRDAWRGAEWRGMERAAAICDREAQRWGVHAEADAARQCADAIRAAIDAEKEEESTNG